MPKVCTAALAADLLVIEVHGSCAKGEPTINSCNRGQWSALIFEVFHDTNPLLIRDHAESMGGRISSKNIDLRGNEVHKSSAIREPNINLYYFRQGFYFLIIFKYISLYNCKV